MTTTTELYLQLQRIYRAKAGADVAAVQAHLREILTANGRAEEAIPFMAVKNFCKNSRNLRRV